MGHPAPRHDGQPDGSHREGFISVGASVLVGPPVALEPDHLLRLGLPEQLPRLVRDLEARAEMSNRQEMELEDLENS
jgi:hypothetical protein